MRFIKNLLVIRPALILALVLPIATLADEVKNLISKDSGLIEISQAGIESKKITSNEKFSQELLEVKTEAELEIESRNEKRLDHYKNKLNSYNPPSGPMSILVTGYSSTPDQTWGDPFTTASGTHVHNGTMACPPQYPFGTKVQIEGKGTFTCEDRGGMIKGNHFDMWFTSRAEALAWGKRIVIATIEK